MLPTPALRERAFEDPGRSAPVGRRRPEHLVEQLLLGFCAGCRDGRDKFPIDRLGLFLSALQPPVKRRPPDLPFARDSDHLVPVCDVLRDPPNQRAIELAFLEK